MIITEELLLEFGACEDEVDLFKRFLGKRKYVLLTPKNVREAEKCGLNVVWFIENLATLLVSYKDCFLVSPELACCFAKYVEEGPSDDTRAVACEYPMSAFEYANVVDKCPRDDTREAACEYPISAFEYANVVDKCPRDDTRAAACRSSYWALRYARDVDDGPTEETRKAVSRDKVIRAIYETRWGVEDAT